MCCPSWVDFALGSSNSLLCAPWTPRKDEGKKRNTKTELGNDSAKLDLRNWRERRQSCSKKASALGLFEISKETSEGKSEMIKQGCEYLKKRIHEPLLIQCIQSCLYPYPYPVIIMVVIIIIKKQKKIRKTRSSLFSFHSLAYHPYSTKNRDVTKEKLKISQYALIPLHRLGTFS